MNSIINLVRFCGVIKFYDEHNSNIISCLILGWVGAGRGEGGKIGDICNSITYMSSEREILLHRECLEESFALSILAYRVCPEVTSESDQDS